MNELAETWIVDPVAYVYCRGLFPMRIEARAAGKPIPLNRRELEPTER